MKQHGSLKDIVYQSILNGIFTDEYKPNQIINEQELVQKFGYSKTPIREALVALCNEGILRSFPRFGYQVVSLTREDVAYILNYRLILESGFLRQSFSSLTDEKLNELLTIDEQCRADTDSIWVHWEANTNFHLKLLSFSGNEYACQELERSMNILKRAYAQFYWQTWNNKRAAMDIAHHTDIIESLRKKDLDQALAYLRDDLEDFCV
ncbi:MAG: GntR family transcriptional regulator [Fusicatenibacter sp.]|nr:GntR family transcriptional regulator [Lachnospiraceae bacterium]MDY2937791.1 GntR family transcriptional regulator [Fusicatenibacter sp.]